MRFDETKLRATLTGAGLLDLARAPKATEETRDSVFTKLNNYVVLVHELGICTEKIIVILIASRYIICTSVC